MKQIVITLIIAFMITSCNRTKDKAKEVIKGGGEIVGKTVGEFGKGVVEGVEETFQYKIAVSEELKNKGIALGKIEYGDRIGEELNTLSVYVIFNQSFKDTVYLKVYDNNGLEMGRSNLLLEAPKGHAMFYEFKFDLRADIDYDSIIEMN